MLAEFWKLKILYFCVGPQGITTSPFVFTFSIDDLLTAGINKASHLVVVNRELITDTIDTVDADAETIVNVQTVHR